MSLKQSSLWLFVLLLVSATEQTVELEETKSKSETIDDNNKTTNEEAHLPSADNYHKHFLTSPNFKDNKRAKNESQLRIENTNKENESHGYQSVIDAAPKSRKLTINWNTQKGFEKSEQEVEVQPRDVADALEHGRKKLQELVKIKEPQLYKLGYVLTQNDPAAKVAKFGAPSSTRALLLSRVGYATLEASKKIAELYNKDVGRHSSGILSDFQARTDFLEECPLRGRPRCPPFSRRFRTPDGTCNNIQNPWKGASMLPMQRFLPPVYEDGIQAVRLSIFGSKLPSPRQISTVIHRDRNREIQTVTLMFMQWGQFIDHDITSTVKSRGFNDSIPRCCDDGGRRVLPPEFLHPSCLPIEVPRNDPFLNRFGIGCMEFIRSAPSTRIDCELGWREQINQATPYIDASTIYGSDFDTADSLRTFRNGKIFYGMEDACASGALSDDCLLAGDSRFNENPGLTAMHTIFVRYHNKIAAVLSQINPHWSDERVFQETRRIVYSAIQHITYREFLPVVLGPEVMDLFELRTLKRGFYTQYDSRLNSAIANSFSTAAFRFGHSMVQNSFIRTDSHHFPLLNNVSLHNELSNVENIFSSGSVDRFLLGMANQPAQKRDEFIADELTNHLFQFSDSTPFGMDLAATNIQRGRDHGLPPYTFWRGPCGLSPINDWRDLEQVMSISSVIRLKTLYAHVDDIDLFTAGLAEKPLRGGVVGPTFACIIAQQFTNLRKGDRFWYENEGFESSFSPVQLQQIRRISLAQILCQTMAEIETIQPFVFLSADTFKNARISCDSPDVRNFDIGVWAETLFDFNSLSEDELETDRSQKSDDSRLTNTTAVNLHRIRRDTTKHKRKRTTTTTERYMKTVKKRTSSTTSRSKYNVPKRPTFSTASKSKPNYNQIKDQQHTDVTYLLGIVPERTKNPPVYPPLQLNININYLTPTASPVKKGTTTPNYAVTEHYSLNRPNDFYSRPPGFQDNMDYATSNGLKRPNIYNSHRPTTYDDDDRFVRIPQVTYRPTYNEDRNDFYNQNKRPIYISTISRPSTTTYETQPFSTSNRPAYNYWYTTHRPATQPEYYNDDFDVSNEFFDKENEGIYIGDSRTDGIDDKLDFKTRVIVNPRTGAASSKFVQISSVKKVQLLGREAPEEKKARVKRDKAVRILDIKVTPSESSGRWKFFNTTKEDRPFDEVPELPVNIPCSYEVPKPMTEFFATLDKTSTT